MNDANTPINDLKIFIRNKPDSIIHLNESRFKELVRDVFKNYYDCEIEHVGGPNEKGSDLFLINSNNPKLLQIKRYSSLGLIEDIKPVKELVGSLILNKINNGILVTSAETFSNSAIEITKSGALEEHKIELTLMDRDNFLKMLKIKTVNLEDYWNKIGHLSF